jgi:hypothetical protein
MSDARERIRAQLESLQEELRAIPPHRFNAQKIADRKRGIVILQDQLARIEAAHAAFLACRAELVGRYSAFVRKGGR